MMKYCLLYTACVNLKVLHNKRSTSDLDTTCVTETMIQLCMYKML